ncbi:serine/threonine-protein kinase [Aliikangiella sp. G2MR2-5]|uniref:serine/threonine protein kinase n=1 Tax=Aliikangiella sp. G2MR2-5 TaxID=2788943 RepID=UPI0018AAB93A
MSTVDIPGYKIVKTLGVGGQATVYLAIQKGFDREVALKVMSPALAADPTFGERFIREAKIVAKLSHKSIVTVYDVGESGNFYYLAMEYLPGGDLRKRIEEGMKAREALTIIEKLASALHFAHEKGYIHRDVKSENILFNLDGEPLLTDFGIAKASDSSTQMTQTGKLIGTPEYMSPEQCRGKTVDGRSDLYSLGVIFYEMLTKTVPYKGEDSVAVCIKHVTKPVPQLPVRLKHFQWLIDLLLAKDPEKRFQNGIDLAKAINEFKSSGKQGKSTATNQSPGSKSRQPSRTVVRNNPHDDITDEDIAKFDDLHTERRVYNEPEKKSGIGLYVAFITLVLVGVGGYFSKEKWLPYAQPLIAKITGDTSQQEAKPDLGNSQKDANNDAVNKQENKPVESSNSSSQSEPPSPETLLQEADALVQFLPQKIEDIKKALKLVATVKTLDETNTNAELVYQNIISVSLSEAVTLAEASEFEKAEIWLKLVEVEKPDHPLLGATQQKISNLKQSYQGQQDEIAKEKAQLNQWLTDAALALQEKRLSSPVRNNAIYFYQEVLKLQPENGEAIEGLEKVSEEFESLIAEAIKQNSYAKAKTMLTRYGSISDNEAKKNALRQLINQSETQYKEEQKERQRKEAIAEKKRKEEQARNDRLNDPLVQMSINSRLLSAKTLEEQMVLVEPAGNNALDKYKSVLEIDDRNQDAKDGIERIEARILAELTEKIAANNKDDALLWLNKLRILNSEHSQLSSYEAAINNIVVPEPETSTESDESAGIQNSESLDAVNADDSIEQSPESIDNRVEQKEDVNGNSLSEQTTDSQDDSDKVF